MPPLVETEVAGRSLGLVYGSYPSTPDYDYGWQVALASEASSVLNIGANQGQTALNVLVGANVDCIILVEPNPEALAVAGENLIRNGLSQRVRFLPYFISDTCGDRVTMYVKGAGAAASVYRSHASTAVKSGDRLVVTTRTIDDLVDGIDGSPDLWIVDVEGSEYAVLLGAVRTVKSLKPRILVEVHSPEEVGGMAGNAKKILSWCQRVNYRAWYLARGEELLDVRQIAGRGRCHLLLQCADLRLPDALHTIPQAARILDAIALTSSDSQAEQEGKGCFRTGRLP